MYRLWFLFCVISLVPATPAPADSPFATTVIDYQPAPGQFINDSWFNDPSQALGTPEGSGTEDGNDTSVVSLGAFGGSITLGFDHAIEDSPANPFGLDFIVFGNTFWAGLDPLRKWTEAGVVGISQDTNNNGIADDTWYIIPGSHLPARPMDAYDEYTWDNNFGDPTYPPANPAWWPAGQSGTLITGTCRLPQEFEPVTTINPNTNGTEYMWGYAELGPVMILGDTDGDNQPDDPSANPADFYTRPDNPFITGITPGCGGGDGFDIAWAVHPDTGVPANLQSIDFVRVTTAVLKFDDLFGEKSVELDAVSDIAEGTLGDAENDGDIDLDDYSILVECLKGPEQTIPTSPCTVMDFDQDNDVDLKDVAAFTAVFND